MNHFEKRLKNLFDFQRFEQHPAIETMMKETEQAYQETLLSDDELSMVFAAGENNDSHNNDENDEN